MPAIKYSLGLWEGPESDRAAIAAALQDISKTAFGQLTGLTDNGAGAGPTGTIAAIPLPVASAVEFAGALAGGTITITTNPAAADTLTIAGTAITFETSGATGNQVNLGGTAILTADALYTFLAASVDANLVKMTYAHVVGTTLITCTAAAATFPGTAGNALTLATSVGGKITLSAATLTGGTDVGTQKAAFETALGTVRNALMGVVDQCNVFIARVPAHGTLVDSIGGAAPGTTIAAITKTLTGVATSFASYTGTVTAVNAYKAAISQACLFVNALAVAAGQTPIVDNSGGVVPLIDAAYPVTVGNTSLTFIAIGTTTGTAVSGADAGATNGGFTVTTGAATLAGMAAALKEMTSKLNACQAAGATLVPQAICVA